MGSRRPHRGNNQVDATAPGCRLADSFTLTELLAVTLIIVVLAGMIIGLAGYVQTRSARSRVQAQMAMIEAACEAFKADTGRYPTSTPGRATFIQSYSTWLPNDIADVENSHLLFQQLMAGGYISAASFQVKPTPVADTWIRPSCDPDVWHGWVLTNRYQLIVDPWGQPYGYYCTYPRPTGAASTETVAGSCDFNCQVSGVWTLCTGSYTHLRSNGPQVNLTYDLWSTGPNRKNEQGRGDDIANFQW